MRTVWVLGDQLNREIASLEGADPSEVRILMVEAEAKVRSKPFHRERLRLVLEGMRGFARELARAGFSVDHRRAATFADGLAAHVRAHRPESVTAMEPMSWDGRAMLEELGVELVRGNRFLCHYEDFAAWAGDRRALRMEDFYRHQRRRLGYLMDRDSPPADAGTSTPRTGGRPRAAAGGGRARRPPGRPPAAGRSGGCGASSTRRCRASGPTRTRCSRTGGCSPTRRSRPT